ncbi:hypothetical protein R80B4_02076 [Fibrobacteres bacterium R8-0-B4]
MQTDITNKFADKAFRAYVYRKIGKTSKAPILDSDVSEISYVDVGNEGISDLSGIEYFTALTVLNCGGNRLTALDVSNNPALTVLNCGCNRLTALDVSNNPALTVLYCWNNQLTALDVSKNTALTCLEACYNKSDIIGLIKSITTAFEFDPQRTQ